MIDSSLGPDILSAINYWLNSGIDNDTKAEINDLLKSDPIKLKDAFCKKLEFGTGGMRSLVGVGTNRLNKYTIQMATQGLANYINQQNIKNPSVVISFDSRTHSRFFAEETAKVLSANGIKVHFTKNLRPTPFVSFACRELKCTAAVMITASHNPPEYNGYKVYWSDGGQVLPPHDTGIIEEYKKVTSFSEVKTGSLKNPNIEFIDEDFDKLYFTKMIENIPDKEFLAKNGKNLEFVYTNLHGTGITLAPKAFEILGLSNFETVKKQESTDGNFPFAKKPNPEEVEALQLGMDQLISTNKDILIANDPDADRMAAVINYGNQATILTGNQIASILVYYICEKLFEQNLLGKNMAFVKSIVTSDLFKEIVESYNMTCVEVLTGFKYIAEKINEFEKTKSHTFVFGAEESYGYLKGTYCRDKDGILAACLLAEVALKQKLKNKTLLDLLFEIYHKFGIYREGQKSIHFKEDAQGHQKMQTTMQALRENPPKIIAESEIRQVDDYLTQKSLDLITDMRKDINLPKSNVLGFTLSDKTKIIIRPSGTEPKIKIYASVIEKNVNNILEDIKKTDARLNNYLTLFTNEIA